MHTAARLRRALPALLLVLVLLLSALPRASAAGLENLCGIQLLSFDQGQILSIGNQAPGKCSLYALRYARTILDGAENSGAGMWSNGAVWSAGGYSGFAGSLSECLDKLYSELNAGRPVIVHLQNTAVRGVSKHPNRTSTEEYHLTSAGWDVVNYPHIATSSTYGHWVCVVGYDAAADPEALSESTRPASRPTAPSPSPASWTAPSGPTTAPSRSPADPSAKPRRLCSAMHKAAGLFLWIQYPRTEKPRAQGSGSISCERMPVIWMYPPAAIISNIRAKRAGSPCTSRVTVPSSSFCTQPARPSCPAA